MTIESQIRDVLLGVDSTAAAAMFQTGKDITISARCGMALLDHNSGTYKPDGPHGIEEWALLALAAALDKIQKDHCINAIVNDMNRARAILSVLTPYMIPALNTQLPT